jgi:GNAT superfamily N-acetyltransferase
MSTRVRAPKGFHFTVGKENRSCDCHICRADTKNNKQVNLFFGDKEIGNVTLIFNQKKNSYVTHSWLSYDYHNKGLGSLMYAKAIQWCLDHGYGVSSSNSPSFEATRVWKGRVLRKFFLIRRKSVRSHTWHAYSK